MTVLNIPQTLAYASQAGFSGQGLVAIVSIAIAESGLDTQSKNATTSGVGIDRGLVKLNSYFHSEVPDPCAYDALCSMQQAYKISNGGTDFHEWCTAYTDGACGTKGGKYVGYNPGQIANVTAALASANLAATTSSSVATAANRTSAGPLDVLSEWVTNPTRIMKLVLGVVLLAIALLLFLSPEGTKVGKAVMSMGGLR